MQHEFRPSVLRSAYAGRTVWISGHTGFKGAWLSTWLLHLGATVHGASLEPPTTPSLFDQAGLKGRLHDERLDLRDARAVVRSIERVQPDFVFHCAAQATVRASFVHPVDTYATNLTGTIHLLEALRTLQKPCAAVLVTSDKCYENREQAYAYTEEDHLGGFDPYSSSKAAAELAIASWRRSFFSAHPVRIASARAGNVIGGGDWAKDRIVPDSMRALADGSPILVRNKEATRTWQHVLDVLSGYLWLGAVLLDHSLAVYGVPANHLASTFNFGPPPESNRTVEALVVEVLKHWPGEWRDASEPHAVHEAGLLNLSIDKALQLLAWKPVWPFEKAVEATVHWYRQVAGLRGSSAAPTCVLGIMSRQISDFEQDAAAAGAAWM
jgi:CDP-glucose 4,6-dehydratase